MSRIGKRKLTFDKDIKASYSLNELTLSNSKGSLSIKIPEILKLNLEQNTILLTRINELKTSKQIHGTFNALILNMIVGLKKGYKQKLKIVGVGYKAELKKDILVLYLGFSHLINYKIPSNVIVKVLKPTILEVSGIDKQKVFQVAAQIRNFKKPEPYKGKGIMYENEQIIRKEGKTASK